MHKKIKIIMSSGDEDFWSDVFLQRTEAGYLKITDGHGAGEQAEYAPGMWMKWEVME